MLAFAFGPLYGGFLTETLYWRVTFWTDVALLLIAAALLFTSLRGPPRGRTGINVDVVGAILLGLGSFLVVLALQQGQSWGWTSSLFLPAAGLSNRGFVYLALPCIMLLCTLEVEVVSVAGRMKSWRSTRI